MKSQSTGGFVREQIEHYENKLKYEIDSYDVFEALKLGTEYCRRGREVYRKRTPKDISRAQ